MAFPTIPTVAAGRILFTLNTAGGATKTFPSLTSLTKNAGDLLIAICVEYDGNSTNAEFSSWGGSFTETADRAGTTTMAIGVAHKWSTGSETGTFTVTTADTSTNDSVMILMSIPGAHASTPPEVSVMTTSTAAPPAVGTALNPGAWDVEETLWIAVGGSGETSTTGSYTGLSASPTNYSGDALSGITADVVGGVDAGVGFRQLSAASEAPGAWSADTSNARGAALVIAVRPVPIVPTATGVARISLASGNTPETQTDHAISVKARTTSGSTGKINVALYEGANNRSGNLVQTGSLTNSLAAYTISIGDTEAATITDYSDLEIRLWGTDASGGALVFEVAEVSLNIPEGAAGPAEHFGVATQALTFTSTTVGKVEAKAAVTQALTFSATTQGAATKSGAATQALTATFTTTGVKASFGEATQALTFTSTTIGKVTAKGASATALTFGSTTLGKVEAFAAVVLPLSLTATTQGTKTTSGAIALPLAFTSTTEGDVQAIQAGAVVLPLSLGVTTQGKVTTTGAVVLPLSLTSTTQGIRTTGGAATQALVFAFTTAGARTNFGSVVLPLTFTSTTAGLPTRFGQSALALAYDSTSVGLVTTQGVVVLPLSVALTSAGSASVLGSFVSLDFLLDVTTSGTMSGFEIALLDSIWTGQLAAGSTRGRTAANVMSPIAEEIE